VWAVLCCAVLCGVVYPSANHSSTYCSPLCIDNLWLTPAFQGKKFGLEALLLVLTHLFAELNYRRVSYEIDLRHTLGRKFLLKCGFKLEATLHKNRIVQERNRDSCVYVILNSDWCEVEQTLRKHCGLPEVKGTKLHNIAEIDSIEDIVESIAIQAECARQGGGAEGGNTGPAETGVEATAAVPRKRRGGGKDRKK